MNDLLLLHGALGGADQLKELQNLLKDEFKIHVLEFDGHGERSRSSSEAPFTIDVFVTQLNSFIKGIGREVHIFGYSMGGFVALLSAAGQNQAIKSITTLGTKLLWTSEIAEIETKQLNAEMIKEKVPRFFKILEQRHGVYWIDVLDRTADLIRALGSNNPIKQDFMKNITCPVQLLLGDQDEMVTKKETEKVRDWIGNSSMHILQNAHHPIEKVNTRELADLILQFVRGIN